MKYCSKCGSELVEGATFCSSCGAAVNGENNNVNQNVSPNTNQNVSQNVSNGQANKSKILAGLLGIFLGSLGVHNFYLGYNNKGIAQILLTLIGWILCGLGPVIAAVWGLIEGILILTGSVNVDANGNVLVD